MEQPYWPSVLALFAEEIEPDLENAQYVDMDVDVDELCAECGAQLEDGVCPYCQDNF